MEEGREDILAAGLTCAKVLWQGAMWQEEEEEDWWR